MSGGAEVCSISLSRIGSPNFASRGAGIREPGFGCRRSVAEKTSGGFPSVVCTGSAAFSLALVRFPRVSEALLLKQALPFPREL